MSALPGTGWQPLPWPDDGTDPFDATDAGTQWFASRNGGITRVFPAGDWRDLGSSAFERAVPMGYSQLWGEERRALCLDGVVAGEWPAHDGSPDGTWRVHHLALGARAKAVRTNASSYADAFAEARRLSRTGARRALVSRVLREQYWH